MANYSCKKFSLHTTP